MGAIIAVADKQNANAFDAAATMLETLSHRGNDSFDVASPDKIVRKSNLRELRKESVDSDIIIGHNIAEIIPTDKTQPTRYRDLTLVLHGRLFPISMKTRLNTVLEQRTLLEKKAKNLIVSHNGAYAFAIAKENRIVVGRDAVGGVPLYFGENKNFCTVATEKKALWKIGITNTRSFPPGTLALVNKSGFFFETVKNITQPQLQQSDMETTAKRLKEVLLRSTRQCVSDTKRVAVAFSGGIDSSLIAYLAKLCNVEIDLIYVSLKGQKENAYVERVAKTLNLPFHHIIYSVNQIRECLPKVLWLIEEANPLMVSIAIPLFWVAEQSAKLGCHVLITGQGADELFGGYYRYLKNYARYGLAGLQRRLYKDVVSSYESNLERDDKACAFHKVELRMPYTDWNVIQLGLSIPAGLKIFSRNDPLRKRILRFAARKLGIPKFIADKPKKAIQYATGVNQEMRKLAKEEGLTLREYVEKTFLKIYGMLE
ncbi:MAG: asparagine synthetase B [Candidatus Bathyarchaeota archaeon]|nr:MAG: asparagine synthetase B [Candidatus Bathyarchaeota archaeon]